MTLRNKPDCLDTARLLGGGLLDGLDQGVSIFDRDLRLLAHNRRFVELLGFPPGVVQPGVPFGDLVRHLAERGELGPIGDVGEIVRSRVQAASRCQRSYTERTTLDGRILAAQTTPLPEGGFITVYTELTERSSSEALTPARSEELEGRVNQRTVELRTVNEKLRRKVRELEAASAALQKSEAHLRLITDALPVAIAYVDDQRVLRFVNRRFAELFRRGELVGRSLRRVLGPRLLAAVSPHLDRAFGGEPRSFEHAYRQPDGRPVITRNMLVPEFSPHGSVPGLFLLCLDVTEEKGAERARQEAQKMSAIGQLAGGLAHDFNNLLTVIVGSMRALQERIDDPLVREFVAPAIRASTRGTDITRRLLAIARQQALDPAPVDVPALIAGAAELLRRSLPSPIAIRCTSDEQGWPALADPGQLENALVNLALNARDAMPAGGLLTFHTEYEHRAAPAGVLAAGDYVRITVTDTGCGISPEAFTRLFEPFFTTKPFGSGSGLGLSMVFGFVRQSGGDIQISSEPGKGTTVTLLLPRAQGPAIPLPPPAEAAVANGGGKLVLLVEDHEDVRQTVRRQLLELGYRVLEARDSDDAHALLSAVPEVAALVSDVVMPGATNGVGLADAARRLVPGIRIVLITGFTGPSPGQYEWFDERLVLRKPFGKEELARALEVRA